MFSGADVTNNAVGRHSGIYHDNGYDDRQDKAFAPSLRIFFVYGLPHGITPVSHAELKQ